MFGCDRKSRFNHDLHDLLERCERPDPLLCGGRRHLAGMGVIAATRAACIRR